MIRFPRMQFYELFAKGFAAVVFRNLSEALRWKVLIIAKLKTSSSSQQSDSGTTVLSKHWSLQAVRAAQDKQVEHINLRQAAALQSMFTNTFFALQSAICKDDWFLHFFTKRGQNEVRRIASPVFRKGANLIKTIQSCYRMNASKIRRAPFATSSDEPAGSNELLVTKLLHTQHDFAFCSENRRQRQWKALELGRLIQWMREYVWSLNTNSKSSETFLTFHPRHQITANFSIQTPFRLRKHCNSSTCKLHLGLVEIPKFISHDNNCLGDGYA